MENKLFMEIHAFFKRIKKHNIGEYTAQCAYYTILSFIPFIIILLTLIQYTNIQKETLFIAISAFIPNSMNQQILNIIQEIYSKSFGTISISALIVLWSAGRSFFALCKGFHIVYEIPKKRSYIYFKLKGIISTMVFTVVIVLTLLLIIFGSYITEKIGGRFETIGFILQDVVKFSNIGLIAFLFIIFLFMYKYIPNHRVRLKDQIPGALFASIVWSIISYAFSLFVNIFKGFSLMYGSLTTAILIMMWVYVCMYVILLGAEINSMIAQRRKK
ncbi:MAG: YihY/virulence factor BrkB family protein [Clostridia bacterium]|nr:YihY/virulence factor BrkB family protein [Clostridia bacterium]